MIKGIGIGFIMLTLGASSGSAQQHQHEAGKAAKDSPQVEVAGCSMMTAMMGGGEMAMMPWMQFLPDHVLKNKGALKLSADQVSRIDAMRGRMPESHGKEGVAMKEMPMKNMPMMTEMHAEQQHLRAAFEKAPTDTAAIRTAVGKVTALHGTMMAAHLGAAAHVRDVLTKAQREQLAKMPPILPPNRQGMMRP